MIRLFGVQSKDDLNRKVMLLLTIPNILNPLPRIPGWNHFPIQIFRWLLLVFNGWTYYSFFTTPCLPPFTQRLHPPLLLLSWMKVNRQNEEDDSIHCYVSVGSLIPLFLPPLWVLTLASLLIDRIRGKCYVFKEAEHLELQLVFLKEIIEISGCWVLHQDVRR